MDSFEVCDTQPVSSKVIKLALSCSLSFENTTGDAANSLISRYDSRPLEFFRRKIVPGGGHHQGRPLEDVRWTSQPALACSMNQSGALMCASSSQYANVPGGVVEAAARIGCSP